MYSSYALLERIKAGISSTSVSSPDRSIRCCRLWNHLYYKMRYGGVLISGLLGGLGGIVYITAGVSVWKFENGVAGFGFLALAVMIFGAWHPLKIGLASLLFGFLRALGNVYSGFPMLAALEIPSFVYNMMP